MTLKVTHLTDEELLLAAYGELHSRRAEEVSKHLLACTKCNARSKAFQISIAEFSRLHHATLDPRMPPPEDSRHLLQAQLSELAAKSPRRRWWQTERFAFATAAAILALAYITGSAWQHRANPAQSARMFALRDTSLPDPMLTPGSYQPVRLEDICAAKPYEQARVTSVSLKQEVLHEYGMPQTDVDNHEIDYLVIPELGGKEDIQNLWPEPYDSTIWNAGVKDELEERLHQMVCNHQLDIETAQRDIATDWISAYKKYFHTDKPLSTASSS